MVDLTDIFCINLAEIWSRFSDSILRGHSEEVWFAHSGFFCLEPYLVRSSNVVYTRFVKFKIS